MDELETVATSGVALDQYMAHAGLVFFFVMWATVGLYQGHWTLMKSIVCFGR